MSDLKFDEVLHISQLNANQKGEAVREMMNSYGFKILMNAVSESLEADRMDLEDPTPNKQNKTDDVIKGEIIAKRWILGLAKDISDMGAAK